MVNKQKNKATRRQGGKATKKVPPLNLKPRTFSIITLFPDMIRGYTDASMLGRAQKNKLINVKTLDLRSFATDKHQKTDDRPYGGGPGMVLKAEPVLKAIEKAVKNGQGTMDKKRLVVVTTPRGKQFDDGEAQKLAKKYDEIVFICGRYEGIDARVQKIIKAREYSVGPYVLTGGELPALTMLDAIVRHIPGVLGDAQSLEHTRLAPQDTYTRPETLVWKKKKYTVPAVLRSGHHAEVEAWREKTSSKKKR